MVRIAPVRLQYNPKTLWFDPGELELNANDPVVVSTERGTEFGHTDGIIEVEEEQLKRLRSKLKPVLRKATEEDLEKVEELRRKGKEALPVFKQFAAEENENMHPVLVEYLFDGDKAIFFFEAEERIDFRNLVRKLAGEFHIRVDMRQIGVRDEARLVGGLGHCGQELCCRRLGGEFCPVSIRMAKEQDMSLNPQKISGVCGRLMCCLRYEFEAYKEFKSRAPKANAKISTPHGTARVVELDVPREMVTVRLEGDDAGKKVTFPLSAMDEPEEGSNRPNSIGEAFEEYANPDPFQGMTSIGTFDTASFTRDDKLAKPEARHNPQSKSKSRSENSEKPEGSSSRKRRRRRRGSGGSSERSGGEAQNSAAATESPKRSARRRRGGSNAGKKTDNQKQSGSNKQAASSRQGATNKPGASNKPGGARPGQKSSGLSAERKKRQSSSKPKTAARKPQHSSSGGEAQPTSVHRKPRRRSHTTKPEA